MMIFNVHKLRHFYANRKKVTDSNEIGVFRQLLHSPTVCAAAAFSYFYLLEEEAIKIFSDCPFINANVCVPAPVLTAQVTL